MAAVLVSKDRYRGAQLPRRSGYKRCAKCGKVVSLRAFQCRRCGKRQRWNPRTVWVTATAAFLAVLFAYAGFGSKISFSRSIDLPPLAPPRGASAAPVATPAGHPVRLTASELWAAYNRDLIAADHRYRERKLEVTGTVVTVPVRDYRGFIVVRLGTGDVFETVHATLARRDSSLLSGIAKGQSVVLSCTGRGALIGSPILDDCEVR